MKQQCKIRPTQCEKYTLFIENQFIFASLTLWFIINLRLYIIYGQRDANDTGVEEIYTVCLYIYIHIYI